jgi:beta-phosphoglucomutase family hydrolase
MKSVASPQVGLIFDMDGVIVDSNPIHERAWLEYNRSQGVETTEAMQQRMYGKRNDAIVRDFLGEHLSETEIFAHGAAKERLYRDLIAPRMPDALVPGVREFLERHQDLAVGCATNAEPANVDFILDAGKIRQFFRVAVDGHQVERPKPFPDIYLRAAELLDVDPRRCIVFEDSYTGIDAAHAAGMKVVAIRTTHHHFPDVELAVDDFRAPELEPFVQEFIQNGRARS